MATNSRLRWCWDRENPARADTRVTVQPRIVIAMVSSALILCWSTWNRVQSASARGDSWACIPGWPGCPAAPSWTAGSAARLPARCARSTGWFICAQRNPATRTTRGPTPWLAAVGQIAARPPAGSGASDAGGLILAYSAQRLRTSSLTQLASPAAQARETHDIAE